MKIPDLYNEEGIYWYTGGWNLRGMAAIAVGMIPGLPGFLMTVINSEADNAAIKIFQIYYFIGFPLGIVTYVTLCYLWPVAGLGEKILMIESEEGTDSSIIEGEGIDQGDEKNVVVSEKQKLENDRL